MNKNIFIFLLLVLSANALKSQGGKTRYWYVADAKVACQVNNTITSCLKVRSNPDSMWRDFPWEIEGYLWEPGTETLIELEETPILYPEDNGPKSTYKFIRVIEVKNTVLKNRAILGSNKWKLINIQTGTTQLPMVRKVGAWVIFDLDSNTLQGFGGCNSFGGNAEVKEGEINFGQMMSTLKSCTNDSIERDILDGLKSTAQFYIRNNMLFITCQNNMTYHFRPEKRIDSLVNKLNKPTLYRGNTFNKLRNGQYGVTLDDVNEAGNRNFIFNVGELSATQKKTIKVRLVNSTPDDIIKELHILSKPHATKGTSYAIVVLKDGAKLEIQIKNVL